MSKQVGLPKMSSILQKVKISQKLIYTLFARRPSIVIGVGLESATIAVWGAEEIFQWEGEGQTVSYGPWAQWPSVFFCHDMQLWVSDFMMNASVNSLLMYVVMCYVIYFISIQRTGIFCLIYMQQTIMDGDIPRCSSPRCTVSNELRVNWEFYWYV